MNSNINNCLESAGNKYLKALEKTKSLWHSYCGCETPGLETKCHGCPYFIEFVENMQKNLPEEQEYSWISTPSRSCDEGVKKLYLEMFDNGYSISRIIQLVGVGSYKTVKSFLRENKKFRTVVNATSEEKDLICRLYLEGKIPLEIEAITAICEDSIRSYVRKKGIIRSLKIYSKEEKEKAVKMWFNGSTYIEIREATGMTSTVLCKTIKEYDLTREKKIGAPRKYSQEVIEQCIKMREEGKTYVEIEYIMNVPTTTISNWYKEKYSNKFTQT